MKKSNYLFFLLSILFSINFAQAQTIRYVTANGTGDGSSWTNASSSIQAMIDSSSTGDEVWVAKGTYYPTTETIARDSRSKTFLLKVGVSLYGGFAGNETDISQRVLADLNADGKTDSCELVNQTILSGDIDGVTDVWTKATNTDSTWVWTVTGNENNCYHVVSSITISSKLIVLDGLYIYGGNDNSSSNKSCGAGIYSNNDSFIKVSNCTIKNCFVKSGAEGGGGGIYLYPSVNSSSYVTNCEVDSCCASSGGGIKCTSIYNCIVSNCSAFSYGGGLSCNKAINCKIKNCSATTDGGGINSYTSVDSCVVSNCIANSGGGIHSSSGSIAKCIINNCIALSQGGGIFVYSSSKRTYISNCLIGNCKAESGGGIYSETLSSVENSTIFNCSANYYGGGIYSLPYGTITNCIVNNCYSSSKFGGIYASEINNCATSNNQSASSIGSEIYASTTSSCIEPDITKTYIYPTDFIGIAKTDAQKAELLTANWHLKESSPCINAGTSTNVLSSVLSGNDLDNNPRVTYGTIDIGAYEYVVPTVNIPITEDFNTIVDWDESNLFYNSAQLNGSQDIVWNISNQKAVFSWETNYTSSYSKPFFTYQIDATNSSNVILKYDMYFEAYNGSISPLGTEKLTVDYSTDLVTWTNIATYSNANGTIANQTYTHDLSSKLAGKEFFIRFNANGVNSNRIEKWEIDNVTINEDNLNAVNTVNYDKYIYAVTDGTLKISGLQSNEHISLYDLTGKLLSAKIANSNNTSFELPCKGIYIVSINSEGIISSKKIVY